MKVTFYARVKVQVKKINCMEQIIISWGKLSDFSWNKWVEHVSDSNIRTKKYYDFAKGIFV